VARSEDKLSELKAQFGKDTFLYSVCDVTNDREVEAAMGAMRDACFMPEIVILNAGISDGQANVSFSLSEFRVTMDTNLFGALKWVELLLPEFIARRKGQFVAISSMAAFRGDARWVAYPASKAALSRSFESLRGRYAKDAIKFSTIHLGQVVTGAGVTLSPFRLSQEQAALKILHAIDAKRGSITIPWYLRVIIELMKVIPDVYFSQLIERGLTESGTKSE